MNKQQILRKAQKVLMRNEYVKEARNSHNKIAQDLKHWEKVSEEDINNMVFICDDKVVLSNETSIEITQYNYTSCLVESLERDFENAGLFVECYDGGTFHISERF
jgi:hypothetical protein